MFSFFPVIRHDAIYKQKEISIPFVPNSISSLFVLFMHLYLTVCAAEYARRKCTTDVPIMQQ